MQTQCNSGAASRSTRRRPRRATGPAPIILPDAMQDAGPERVGVERDGLARALDPQLRLNTCHPSTVAAQRAPAGQVRSRTGSPALRGRGGFPPPRAVPN